MFFTLISYCRFIDLTKKLCSVAEKMHDLFIKDKDKRFFRHKRSCKKSSDLLEGNAFTTCNKMCA